MNSSVGTSMTSIEFSLRPIRIARHSRMNSSSTLSVQHFPCAAQFLRIDTRRFAVTIEEGARIVFQRLVLLARELTTPIIRRGARPLLLCQRQRH
jgi:hypothetical protein